MAFADQEDVFAVLEDVLPPIFAKYGKYDSASSAPFKRIPYLEAMETYGSDKPRPAHRPDRPGRHRGPGYLRPSAPFEGNTVKAVKVTRLLRHPQADRQAVRRRGGPGRRQGLLVPLRREGRDRGRIAKFVQPIKDAVCAALGLEKGTFVGLTAGKKLSAQKTAGVLIKMLAPLCPDHFHKETYEFCWIVDFPMYEIARRAASWSSATTPSPCPTADWTSEKGRRR